MPADTVPPAEALVAVRPGRGRQRFRGGLRRVGASTAAALVAAVAAVALTATGAPAPAGAATARPLGGYWVADERGQSTPSGERSTSVRDRRARSASPPLPTVAATGW